MAEADSPRQTIWLVIKFRGQEDTSAGMAFREPSGVAPSYNRIFSIGTYFKDLKEFRKEMAKRPEISLFIMSNKAFKESGIDDTIFQAFEEKFIDDK